MNIKRKNLRIIQMLLLGLIYSCSPTIRVTNDFDSTLNFSEFKTFEIYDLKAKEGQVSQFNVDRVTKAIRTEMTAKGFTETNSNPDLKVNAVSILKNQRTVTTDSNSYAYGGEYRPYVYWGDGTILANASTAFNTFEYVDGTLIIDIISAKTQKLVWEGIGNAEIDNKPDNPEEFIKNAVKSILAGFPPDSAKKQ